MLSNHTVIAFRGFVKNKVFSLINIVGLSVGLTAFILILLYVRFEFSYDDFHSENIYRIVTKVTLQGEVINHESSTYEGIIRALKEDFPEVKAVTGISAFTSDGTIIRYADRSNKIIPLEKFKGFYADSAFFDVFSFSLVTGDARHVLDDHYSAVISESIASEYFNNDAIGKILEFRDDEKVKRLKITGVIKDGPENSHIKFDLLVNIPDDGRTLLFTVLAVFIGCIGLFGLTSYAIVQRTKEIGIRKVLGASVSNVIALFSFDLVKLLLIANLIGIPVAYAGIVQGLDNYAYRVSLAWWMFALPVVLILLIALLTVGLQTVKVARRNPVDSLKYE